MADGIEADFYDDLGIRYEEAFGHDAGLNKFLLGALNRLAPTASVLDIGSGTGKPTSSMIAASGRRVHGIDYSSVMTELSRKQVPRGSFEHVNMLEYKPKEPFDAAFAIFSLFHLTREEMAIAAAKWPEWIAPSGYIFIGIMVADDLPTEQSMFDADGLYARNVPHMFMGETGGAFLYTKNGWKTILEKVGFEIVQTGTYIFQPPAEAKSNAEPHYYITARRTSSV